MGNITYLWYADAQPKNAQNLGPENLYKTLKKEKASLIYTYNYLGRLISVKDCEGLAWEGRYDKAGRLVWEDGNNMSEKSYSYDDFDRITEVQSGGLVVEKYSYSDRGKKVFYIDGEGAQYSYEKDLYGKLRQETNRLGNSQSYEYEKDGSLKSTNDFSSKIKTITTDEKNRNSICCKNFK